MNFDSFNDNKPSILGEIDNFLKNNDLQNVDVSLHSENYDYVSLKMPYDEYFNSEEFLENIEKQNQSLIYIITTFADYMGEPELKKYFIRYSELNDFLRTITDPNSDEQIISIETTEE